MTFLFELRLSKIAVGRFLRPRFPLQSFYCLRYAPAAKRISTSIANAGTPSQQKPFVKNYNRC